MLNFDFLLPPPQAPPLPRRAREMIFLGAFQKKSVKRKGKIIKIM